MHKALLKERALRSGGGRTSTGYPGISPIQPNTNSSHMYTRYSTNDNNHSDNNSISSTSTSSNRNSYHKKIVERYNLGQITSAAFAEYSAKHLQPQRSIYQPQQPIYYNVSPQPKYDNSTEIARMGGLYRDLEREFQEYDDRNTNSFKFIH